MRLAVRAMAGECLIKRETSEKGGWEAAFMEGGTPFRQMVSYSQFVPWRVSACSSSTHNSQFVPWRVSACSSSTHNSQSVPWRVSARSCSPHNSQTYRADRVNSPRLRVNSPRLWVSSPRPRVNSPRLRVNSPRLWVSLPYRADRSLTIPL
eukprot:906537-Prorocentrum_minimum.AAC.2